MRSRASELINDHFRVADTAEALDDLLVWEGCSADPFAAVTLVAPVFVTEDTPVRGLDPLTRSSFA